MALLCLPLNAEAQTEDRRGGSVDYGELEPVSFFNPHERETQIAANQLFSLIYEGLFRYDYDAEKYIPLLATSRFRPDNEQDVLYIDLRTDVQWHDGRPFTADDVVFTYNYIRAKAPTSSIYEPITVERVNSARVRVTYNKPTSDPLRFFEAWIIPQHFFNGYEPLTNPHSLSRHPVGTGPYKFQERTSEGHVTLAANEAYWDDTKRGNIEQLRMRRITDPGQMGSLAINDYHQLVLKVPPDVLPRMRGSNKFRFDTYASFGFYAFAYNCSHPALSDVQVRRALTQATNRGGMLRQWFGRNGRVVAGPFNKYSPYFDPELSPLDYNADAAKTLLDAAGYKDTNGDNIREMPDGEPLSFELIYRTENVAVETLNGNLVQNYAEDLAEIGIKVQPVPMELNAYTERVRQQRSFDIALVYWAFDPIYDVTGLFVSGGNKNIVHFSDSEVDDLVGQYDEEFDPERRVQLMKRLQRILRDKSPYTFLISEDRIIGFHRSLLNTRVDPYYLIREFPQWYLDSDSRNN